MSMQPSWLSVKETKYGDCEVEWSQPSTKMTDSEFRDALGMGNSVLYSLCEGASSYQTVVDFLGKGTFQEESRHLSAMRLEQDMENLPPLSLRLSHSLARSESLVPGSCALGSIGPWWTDTDEVKSSFELLDCSDDTQVALCFKPDKDSKSTIVTTRLALETPISAPTYDAFDPVPIMPESAVDEPVTGPIPSTMAHSSLLLEEPLLSEIDARSLSTIVTVDIRSMTPKEQEEMDIFPSSLDIHSQAFTPQGYRSKCAAHNVNHNSSFPLHTFGVTKKGVRPNQTGVNKRTIWHSEEVCTHLLSKTRGADDFFHMIEHEFSGKDGGSPNDPLISTIYMDAYKTKTVRGMKLEAYKEAEYQKAVDLEEKKKREILAMKIEAADRILKNKSQEFVGFDASAVSNEAVSSQSDDNSTMTGPLSTTLPPSKDNESLKGFEWRKLPGSIVGIKFFKQHNSKNHSYEKSELFDRCNQPRMVGTVETSKAIDYKIDETRFQTSMQTEFIGDLLEDRFHLSHQINEGQQSKDILLNSDQQYALEHILKVSLQRPGNDGDTKVPLEVKANYGIPEDTSSRRIDDTDVNNEERVIQATRHANYEALQELLDDLGADVETSDDYGNTLLLLSGQQGNKKLCKFLLRRGAYINAQNHAGNTILHYLHEYGHLELADYVIRKGADDTYLNAEGLTCYEGVKRNNLDDM